MNVDTSEAIKNLGLPVAIVCGIGWFFARRLWPWMTKQVEQAQHQAGKAIELQSELKEVIAQNVRATERLIETLEVLRANDARRRSD